MAQVQAPALTTKAGWLTPYALACGYIETAGDEDDAIVLDALQCDRLIYRVSWWEGNYRRQETYRRLTVARKAFRMVQFVKKRVPSLRRCAAD